MKEATGELNMTVITIIIISAIVAFFWLMWPRIKNTINNQWDTINTGGSDPNYSYVETYTLPENYI